MPSPRRHQLPPTGVSRGTKSCHMPRGRRGEGLLGNAGAPTRATEPQQPLLGGRGSAIGLFPFRPRAARLPHSQPAPSLPAAHRVPSSAREPGSQTSRRRRRAGEGNPRKARPPNHIAPCAASSGGKEGGRRSATRATLRIPPAPGPATIRFVSGRRPALASLCFRVVHEGRLLLPRLPARE